MTDRDREGAAHEVQAHQSDKRAESRAPSAREIAADGLVHALGVGLGTSAAIVITALSAFRRDLDQLAPTVVYAVALVSMFTCSAAYNIFQSSRRREWLRRFDHAAIFAMIAGTYTPFTTMRLTGAWSLDFTTAIWTLAAIGIVAKLCQPDRIESISVVLYVALGWIGLIAIKPFMASVETPALLLLVIGGVIYSIGLVFHLKRDLPYQNAIWHGFVLVAASVHYLAVLMTVRA
jgi:hemolysin III